MDEKVLLQDLARLLSAEKSIDKKASMEFAQLFYETILRGIQRDKYVKIKGLGTFKQVEVESRESMNIHTGERFLIDGHVKISFTPDQALKDAVNKPFSHFETVELSDEVSDSDLKEIDDQFILTEEEILEELPVEVEAEPDPKEDIVEPVELAVEPVAQEAESTVQEIALIAQNAEPTVQEVAPVAQNAESVEVIETPRPVEEEEKINLEEEVEPVVAPEPIPFQEPTVEEFVATHEQKSEEPVLVKLVDPVTINQKVEISNDMKGQDTRDSKKHSKYYTLLVVALVLIALGIGYFMGSLNARSMKPTEIVTYVHDTIVVEKPVPVPDTIRTDTVPVVKKDLTTPPVNKPAAGESLAAKKPAEKPQKAEQKPQPTTSNHDKYPQVPGGAYWIVGTAQTYTLRPGETIRLIAERFFGSRQMAPYIIKYNGVTDPDHVAVGTVLNVPKLEPKRK